MALSGKPNGNLESLFSLGEGQYALLPSHRSFFLWLRDELNPQKRPLYGLCIFQVSSFSQTPPPGALSKTRFLRGYRCTRCFPVRGLRPFQGLLHGEVHQGGCTRCFPVRGLRFQEARFYMRPPLLPLHEMLPRKGIATCPRSRRG